jgi:hypothetical protein
MSRSTTPTAGAAFAGIKNPSLLAGTIIPLKRGSDGDVVGGEQHTFNNMNNNTSTNPQIQKSTHKSLAHAIVPELPILMHGSGDVRPECVHPHSVAVLARLIEKYVASLVGAALDAHDVFTDGEVVGGGACLGPPPFRHYAMAGGVEEASDDENDNDEIDNGMDEIAKKRKEKAKASARRKKAKIDYWDVPLPLPPPSSLQSHSSTGNNTDTDHSNLSHFSNDDDDDDDDSDEDDELPMLSPLRRNSSSSTTSMYSAKGGKNGMPSLLRGFAPVDLHANERSRNYYVAAPTVMDARSFIFPVCHDAVLYQRIKEVQASRRAIHRDVVDNALLEVMREEGAKEGRRAVIDAWDAVLGSRANASIEDGMNKNASGGDSAVSPGDKKKKSKGDNYSSSTSNNNIVGAKENEKKKVDNNNNAKNLVVGAGLVDADVDPSWPGLNSLSRGRLW